MATSTVSDHRLFSIPCRALSQKLNKQVTNLPWHHHRTEIAAEAPVHLPIPIFIPSILPFEPTNSFHFDRSVATRAWRIPDRESVAVLYPNSQVRRAAVHWSLAMERPATSDGARNMREESPRATWTQALPWSGRPPSWRPLRVPSPSSWNGTRAARPAVLSSPCFPASEVYPAALRPSLLFCDRKIMLVYQAIRVRKISLSHINVQK
jgi:hypothetical protein